MAGGYALVLHNPFPHLIFALPWIVWLAMRRRQGLRDLCWLGLGYAPVVLCIGLGWILWQQQTLQAGVAATASAAAITGGGAAPGLLMIERAMGMALGLFRALELPVEEIVLARFGGLANPAS